MSSSNILMPFAFDSSRQTPVHMPGGPVLEGSVVYNEEDHEDKLSCYYCQVAKVHYRTTRLRKGSNEPVSAHFHTNPKNKMKHTEECETNRENDPHYRVLNRKDKTKGFQININFDIGPRSGYIENRVMEWHPERGLIVTDKDLADRENISVSTNGEGIEDLLALVQKCQEKGTYDRLSKSKIVYRGHALRWSDFFVIYDSKKETQQLHYSRFQDLADNLRALNARYPGQEGNAALPVLMEARINNVRDMRSMRDRFNDSAEVERAQSERVFVDLGRHDGDKREWPLVPVFFVENENIRGIFSNGRYLVLAEARLGTPNPRGLTRLFISVKDPRQVHAVGDAPLPGAAFRPR